ncbi:MAG: hypothetical protein JO136_16285, partial [Hyphomicrobiales bacterium]|nr:hypothetical protein [Hyphomicrobiales bacterium]
MQAPRQVFSLQRAIAICVAASAFTVSAIAGEAGRFDVARWAANLPTRYAVHGVKTEPTYEEALDLRRDGDVFVVVGGAPGWSARSTESVKVSADGTLLHWPCGANEDCRLASPPAGFLATAAIIAAQRRGALASAPSVLLPFGDRRVVCVDAARLGIERPILDPCFDFRTGAAIAQRHRLSRRFDG